MIITVKFEGNIKSIDSEIPQISSPISILRLVRLLVIGFLVSPFPIIIKVLCKLGSFSFILLQIFMVLSLKLCHLYHVTQIFMIHCFHAAILLTIEVSTWIHSSWSPKRVRNFSDLEFVGIIDSAAPIDFVSFEFLRYSLTISWVSIPDWY